MGRRPRCTRDSSTSMFSRQKAECRRQKAEGRKQKAESRGTACRTPGVYTFHMDVNRLLTLPPHSASPPAPWKGSAFPSASHPLLFLPRRGCASAGENMRDASIGETRSVPGNRNHERMGGIASSKIISAENALERPSLSTEQRAEPFPRQINTTDASPEMSKL